MVRDTARGYAQDKLLPRVLQAFRERKVDRDLIPEMGALGLLGPTIPEEYGGAGLGYVAYGLIAREIETRRFRLSLDAVGAVVAGDAPDLRLWQRGAAAQMAAEARLRRDRRLLRSPPSPITGSDPGSMITRAEKVANGFKLTGAKMWISATRRSRRSRSCGRSSTA
jgi:glutaryl-CoA dehydrogenase